MAFLDRYITAAKSESGRVVFPEGSDPKVVRAAHFLQSEGIAEVVLLGDSETVGKCAAGQGVSLAGLRVIDPAESGHGAAYAEMYAAARGGVREGVARRALRKPLYFGAMMVKAGDVDTMVAGIANPTRRVIEAASLCVGFAQGIETASSFFLMLVPGIGQPMLFADCAVNVDPGAEELAHIALATAQSAARLLEEPPRVAMLSFSTRGSAAHQRVDKVVEALEIARRSAPGLAIDGELQADSALSPAVAAKKVAGASEVAGRANVLIFPDLDSGNIAYKLTQYLAGAESIGPILQGFSRPVADLSRGASVDDIVGTTVLSLALGNSPT